MCNFVGLRRSSCFGTFGYLTAKTAKHWNLPNSLTSWSLASSLARSRASLLASSLAFASAASSPFFFNSLPITSRPACWLSSRIRFHERLLLLGRSGGGLTQQVHSASVRWFLEFLPWPEQSLWSYMSLHAGWLYWCHKRSIQDSYSVEGSLLMRRIRDVTGWDGGEGTGLWSREVARGSCIPSQVVFAS